MDTTLATFEHDVINASMLAPVLVDFWAPWCGPCKTLGPMLEKLEAEAAGKWKLVKVNVDENQELAAHFQVRSIPHVVAFADGRPVDQFIGVLTEGQLREFLAQHGIVPAAAPVAEEVAPAAPLDPQADVARLREAIAAEPDKDELKLDLALALLRVGQPDEAGRLLDALPANLATDDRAVRARARLGFAEALQHAPSLEALQAALQADGNDLRARHLLGVRLLLEGQDEAALEHFIELLRQDRQYADGLPRKTLIDAFRVIEDEDLVGRYRRKMSALLF